MLLGNYIRKIALLSSAFFLISLHAISQNSVLDLLPGAEKLGYNQKLGYQYLVGGVNFVYQGNTMYCDSAHYYDKSNQVRAYGNVHIVKNDINLFCDSLYYNGKSKKAKLWGHVRVRDMEYKLTTDSLEYDAKKGRGVYRHGGKIESIVSNEILTSRIGYFYPESKNFFFSGKVKYRNDDLSMTTDTLQYNYSKQTTFFYGPTTIFKDKTKMKCEKGWYNVKTEEGSLMKNARISEGSKIIEGDTLLYQPKLGKYSGKGKVYFKDTTESVEFFGDKAVNSDKNHFSYITGNALAVKNQGKDTIYIHADTLFNLNDSVGKTIMSKAYHNVKIFNNSVQAKCDSLHFNDQSETLELYRSPIVWAKNVELKGQKMNIFLNDTLIEKVVITNNASAIMQIDSGKYYNQVAGKLMTAWFIDNELIRTDVSGNAKTIFYPEKEEKNDSSYIIRRIGMNRLYSSDLKIYLDSGEVIGVTYFDKPDGVFYPMEEINTEEQFIQGFEWNDALRPKGWREFVNPKKINPHIY